MTLILACTIFCQAQLYDRGTEKGNSCRCCDSDGCDVVEKTRPLPLVMPAEIVHLQKPEEKDSRGDVKYDLDWDK